MASAEDLQRDNTYLASLLRAAGDHARRACALVEQALGTVKEPDDGI